MEKGEREIRKEKGLIKIRVGKEDKGREREREREEKGREK